MKLEIPDEFFSDEEITNTPARYKRFLTEWLEESNNFKFTVFPNKCYDQIIIVKDIDFFSMCSHHLLPFKGKAHIGYIPDKLICGLSKIPRVVDKFAHKPQIQENLTQQIAEYLQEQLKPRGVMVVLEAEHLCMSMRGIKKLNHLTITSEIRGLFRENPAAKEEFMGFIRG